MSNQIFLLIIFNVFVVAMLALDFGFFHRKARVISVREALCWSGFWIALSLLFCLGIYLVSGQQKALEFLAGYLIEKSLSVDNIFVFIMIFSYYNVPHSFQYRVLFWGILVAIIMRAVFIIAGASLLGSFHWFIYIFGAFLVFTAFKIAFQKDKKINPEKNLVLRLFRKIFPVTESYDEPRFLLKKNGKYFATPLLAVLLVVETTDIVFAVDSIPAVLSITTDIFIVYTSNIFAILGLRALYFALAGITRRFYYLRHGLTFILLFVGIKMLISEIYKVPVGIALGVIATIVTVSIIASVIWPEFENK